MILVNMVPRTTSITQRRLPQGSRDNSLMQPQVFAHLTLRLDLCTTKSRHPHASNISPITPISIGSSGSNLRSEGGGTTQARSGWCLGFRHSYIYYAISISAFGSGRLLRLHLHFHIQSSQLNERILIAVHHLAPLIAWGRGNYSHLMARRLSILLSDMRRSRL